MASTESILISISGELLLLRDIKNILSDIQVELKAQGSTLEHILSTDHEIEEHLDEILAIFRQVFPPTTGSKLIQLTGDSMGPFSIHAGGTGTFLRSNLPVGSLGLFPGTTPSYSTTDPAVTIGSDPSDPSNTDKLSCAVAATDTAPSFDLSVTIVPVNADGSQGTSITNVFTITIVQVTPPGVPTTASDLTQTS